MCRLLGTAPAVCSGSRHCADAESSRQEQAKAVFAAHQNVAIPLEILLGSIFGVEIVQITRHVALWGDAVSGGR